MFCIPTYTLGAEVRPCNKIEYITHVCIPYIYYVAVDVEYYYYTIAMFLFLDEDDVDAILYFGGISPLLGVYFLEVVVVSLHRAIRTMNRPFLRHC
mmetsp:Transcript_23901/g.24167  ORF Transcript_23901/g.24167 Transcript_23901/m.24167 type:complete len:96 (-) Transcript_23901:587-874(-)